MNCPVCNVPLTMAERQGVEIDYCQRCRGVWLDRGELDKIIERSDANYSAAGQNFVENRHESRDKYDERRYEERDRYQNEHHNSFHPHQSHKKHKKRESFLSELFDF